MPLVRDSSAGAEQPAPRPLARSRRYQPALARWTAYAACVWALVFAAAHLYWAFGESWLLEAEQVGEARALLAQRPRYYWVSWLSLGSAFGLAGLFPLALARSRSGPLPRWLGRSVVWGACAVLLLLAAALAASGSPPGAPLLFASCAAGLVWTRLRHGTVPPWALRSATYILGSGMALYGTFGLGRLSLWGAWWFLGGVMFLTAAWCNTHRERPGRWDGAR